MSDLHDSRVGGHFGFMKTLQRVKSHYYWPSMRTDVYEFVRKCPQCLANKYERVKPGLLFPWPIPKGTWTYISMDFVLGLPLTNRKNNACLVIVDRFSKQAHFIPVKNTISTRECANVFIKEIFRHHGIPQSILSDRDIKFTSKFWIELTPSLEITLHMETSYHSSADG